MAGRARILDRLNVPLLKSWMAARAAFLSAFTKTALNCWTAVNSDTFVASRRYSWTTLRMTSGP